MGGRKIMGNKNVILDFKESDDVLLNYMKALASKTRIDIVRLLVENCYNINEIAEKLSVPISTVSYSVDLLDEAGIINTELISGKRGSMKVCSLKMDSIHISFQSETNRQENFFSINMPIGNFVDCRVEPTCGMVNELGYIAVEDNPNSFYNPKRTTAQLIWLYKGYLTYRFPNSNLKGMSLKTLEFSCEICSEAPNYRTVWPSDITFWVNGMEVGTWTSPGDLGGRKGKLNPQWWPETNTQYGLLKTIKISKDGSYLDETRASSVDISRLNLLAQDYIEFKIGIKGDAKNQNGINLFGEKFGDYPQNIILTFYYSESSNSTII